MASGSPSFATIGFVCMHGVSSKVPLRFVERFLADKGLLERYRLLALGIVLPDYVERARACDALVSFEGVEARGERVFFLENGRKPILPLKLNPDEKRIWSIVLPGPVFYGCSFDPALLVRELAAFKARKRSR